MWDLLGLQQSHEKVFALAASSVVDLGHSTHHSTHTVLDSVVERPEICLVNCLVVCIGRVWCSVVRRAFTRSLERCSGVTRSVRGTSRTAKSASRRTSSRSAAVGF